MMIQLFAIFESSPYVELSISKLVEQGFRQIYTVPLDPRVKDMRVVDTLHGTDGTSLVDTGLVLAMMFGTIGVSRGYAWKWGPVYWGLLGAAAGFAVGFVGDVIKNWIKRRKLGVATTKPMHIIVIVQCPPEGAETVEHILWNHRAIGVARTKIQTAQLTSEPSASAEAYLSPWT